MICFVIRLHNPASMTVLDLFFCFGAPSHLEFDIVLAYFRKRASDDVICTCMTEFLFSHSPVQNYYSGHF